MQRQGRGLARDSSHYLAKDRELIRQLGLDKCLGAWVLTRHWPKAWRSFTSAFGEFRMIWAAYGAVFFGASTEELAVTTIRGGILAGQNSRACKIFASGETFISRKNECVRFVSCHQIQIFEKYHASESDQHSMIWLLVRVCIPMWNDRFDISFIIISKDAWKIDSRAFLIFADKPFLKFGYNVHQFVLQIVISY